MATNDLKPIKKPIYVTFCHISPVTGKSYYAVRCKNEREANKIAMEAYYIPGLKQVRINRSATQFPPTRIVIPQAQGFYKHIAC